MHNNLGIILCIELFECEGSTSVEITIEKVGTNLTSVIAERYQSTGTCTCKSLDVELLLTDELYKERERSYAAAEVVVIVCSVSITEVPTGTHVLNVVYMFAEVETVGNRNETPDSVNIAFAFLVLDVVHTPTKLITRIIVSFVLTLACAEHIKGSVLNLRACTVVVFRCGIIFSGCAENIIPLTRFYRHDVIVNSL